MRKYFAMFALGSALSSKVLAQNPQATPQTTNSGGSRLSFSFETASIHWNADNMFYYSENDGTFRHFNNFNPGVGFEYRLKKWPQTGVQLHADAGIYYNSIRAAAPYAAIGIEKDNIYKFLGAGIEVGGVGGYGQPVTPAAMPFLNIHTKLADFKTLFIPPVHGIPTVTTEQIRIPFSLLHRSKHRPA